MAKQFWPSTIKVVASRTPLAVVSEAASQLAELTQGLVEANLRSGSTKSGYLVHRLWIEAPTLGYEKKVAKFEHLATPLYPVWAQRLSLAAPVYRAAEGAGGMSPAMGGVLGTMLEKYAASGVAAQQEPSGHKLPDELALETWLSEFLADREVVGLVTGLIATANSGAFVASDETED